MAMKQKQQLEKWRQLFTTITTPKLITRKQFLQWGGLGSLGLVTALVGCNRFKQQTSISVAKPKYILSKEKVFGLPLWMVKFETITVNKNGEVIKQNSNNQAKLFKEDLGNNVILEMVAIPSGKFIMGSPLEEGKDDEKPQHEVTVKSFFMGKYPITQAQWKRVAALPKVKRDLKANPSRFKGDNRPVEQVSWYDAVEFCSRLSKYTNREYRLPSEAEWEYACRAGTTTPFHFGETITTQLANYNGNKIYASEPKGKESKQTTEVGIFPANSFGLYDMHGNVWEWCQDSWLGNYTKAPIDGSAWLNENDTTAMLRGGSWYNFPRYCRSASRFDLNKEIHGSHYKVVGFRVVCGLGKILP
ncbi:formylglycine-generating enzyme family protein [Calothrix sp. FACHB-156]|nr:formylglycine-generating enzyme family protein [Calothrix sp. FACHB-156]